MVWTTATCIAICPTLPNWKRLNWRGPNWKRRTLRSPNGEAAAAGDDCRAILAAGRGPGDARRPTGVRAGRPRRGGHDHYRALARRVAGGNRLSQSARGAARAAADGPLADVALVARARAVAEA